MKNNKRIVASIAFLFIASGLFIGFGKGFINGTEVVNAAPTPTPGELLYTETKPIPEELVYGILFKEVETLKSKDVEEQQRGEPTFFGKSFYESRLSLNTSQTNNVDVIVVDTLAQLQSVDQRIKEIIQQYRAVYPNGELKKVQPSPSVNPMQPSRPQRSLEKLPPPPAELLQLKSRKAQIIMNGKQRISQSLGATKFSEFDAAVHKNATKILIPLNFGGSQLQSPSIGN